MNDIKVIVQIIEGLDLHIEKNKNVRSCDSNMKIRKMWYGELEKIIKATQTNVEKAHLEKMIHRAKTPLTTMYMMDDGHMCKDIVVTISNQLDRAIDLISIK